MTFRTVRVVSRTLVHAHRFRVLQNFVLIAKSTKYTKLTISQPRVGHIEPLRFTSWNISKTPSSTDLKLSNKLNKVICKTKTEFSIAPPHGSPWLPMAPHGKIDKCFWTIYFSSFNAKLNRTRLFLLFTWRMYSMEIVVKSWAWCSAKWRPGDNFVPCSFSGFNARNDRERKILPPLHQEWHRSIFFFTASRKITFVDFHWGEEGFEFWVGIPSKNRKLGTTSKR